MSSNNRKRSRWGDRTTGGGGGDQVSSSGTTTNSAAAAAAVPTVSDQEALEALLASTKSSKEDHQSRPSQNDPSKRFRRDDDRTGRGGRGRGRGGRAGRDCRPGRGRGDRDPKRNQQQDYSYYGNSNRNNRDRDEPPRQGQEYGKSDHPTGDEKEDEDAAAALVEKQKPNFGLSGALAQEQVGDLKFREPPEARAPNTQWRLYVFKNDEALETLHISKQSAYLFGRNQELADIPLLHPSASGQHAVLQYRALPGKEDGRLRCTPYLMDLESTNGSFINGVRIDAARYYQLKKGDVLKFGASTREYVLLTENTTAIK